MDGNSATAAPGVTIEIAGHQMVCDPAGALVWPAQATVILADLHLEKAAALNRRGSGVLPALDTPATLDKLAAVLARWQPACVVALGDSFHDRHGAEALPAASQQRLAAFAAAHRWIWVAGNHDPDLPPALGGEHWLECQWGGVSLRHAPRAETVAAGEIAGHLHPKVRVPTRAGRQARPCFVEDGRRCLLPAFGAYTGGLDCQSAAIADIMAPHRRLHALGRDRLHSFRAAALGPNKDKRCR